MKVSATTLAWGMGALLCAQATYAQPSPYPVTSQQRSTAQQVAQRGVPLEELAPNAPDSYTVKRGDTLWGISGLFLRKPWRWPELWGMNLQTIANPHLIYPGQVLYLEKDGGYARLRTSRSDGAGDTIRLSPRVRSDSLATMALPTLQPHLIEPFLAEPLVVEADTLSQAPRIVATQDERVIMAQNDKAYVRGSNGQPFVRSADGNRKFRIFREAVPLKDPVSGEILGYEAHYLGQATLIQEERPAPVVAPGTAAYIPATVDVLTAKEEIRAGDRLLPEPPRGYTSYTPRAPEGMVDARVVSLYTSTAMRYGAQNQVVAINKGRADGLVPGHVLSIVTQGQRMRDKTDPGQAWIQLPAEGNGIAMVFRTFERVSYVLIMDITRGVEIGDQMVTPQ